VRKGEGQKDKRCLLLPNSRGLANRLATLRRGWPARKESRAISKPIRETVPCG
jgi:hypothetical protein